MKSLRIAVLSTEGVGPGGAVRATRRLVAGLRERNHEVRLISLLPHQAPDGIGISPLPTERPDRPAKANQWLQRAYIDRLRTPLSNTHFSAQVAGCSFGDSSVLDPFDVVNVHWAAGLLAPHTLAEIAAGGWPVVHTLHDMAAFTGGCHYSAGCRQYSEQCAACPQLESDVLGLTRWTLTRKRGAIPPDAVYAVAPSRWLARCAAESGVFAPEQVFTISNSLETDVFRPTGKATAKMLLGVDPDVKTLMFGACDNREHRKGFDLLMGVWNRMRQHPPLSALLREERIRVLIVGTGTDELQTAGMPTLHLGSVRNDSRMALIYSAADVLILPSREDNQPNILLEAMSCGTPVAAFAVGGIPEVVEDSVDGMLIPPFDLDAMAASVVELLQRPDRACAMSAAARDKITGGYRLDVQAAGYEDLFLQISDRHPSRKKTAPAPANGYPSVVSLPVILAPGLAAHPIGMFLDRQAEIDELRHHLDEAQHEIERVKDVLTTATRELLASRCWRWTRRLRGTRQDPEIGARPTADQAAVALLDLVRSKSWELTAPFRLLHRTANLVRRRLLLLRPLRASHRKARIPDPPALCFYPPNRPPEPLVEPPPSQDPGLHIICLHLYHLDLWEEFNSALLPRIGPGTPLYITMPESHAHFIATIREQFDERYCKVYLVENRGLDVYPFLYLFNELALRGIRPRTLTKLHTKKSHHHSPQFAESWRKELYGGLLIHHPAIAHRFTDPNLAMVCSKKWWVHEDENSENYRTERRAIETACSIFGVSPTDHYLSGSMYVVSFDYLERLFAGVDREDVFAAFPTGYHRSGTLAHGFERAICYGLEKFALGLGLL